MNDFAADPLPAATARDPRDVDSDRLGLSVVVPLYREAAGITSLAAGLRAFARAEGTRRTLEFVLVDDGSDDATWDSLQAAFPVDDGPWRTLRHAINRGLTAALRTGSESASQPLVGWLDADLTYDPAVLSTLAADCDAGADLAVASCHHPDGDLEGVTAFRRWLSRRASAMHRLTCRDAKLHTFTCMVRVQRRALLHDTWPERGGFVGVTEQLLRAIRRGARVAERPAVLRVRRHGASKMQFLRTALRHLELAWARPGRRPD